MENIFVNKFFFLNPSWPPTKKKSILLLREDGLLTIIDFFFTNIALKYLKTYFLRFVFVNLFLCGLFWFGRFWHCCPILYHFSSLINFGAHWEVLHHLLVPTKQKCMCHSSYDKQWNYMFFLKKKNHIKNLWNKKIYVWWAIRKFFCKS